MPIDKIKLEIYDLSDVCKRKSGRFVFCILGYVGRALAYQRHETSKWMGFHCQTYRIVLVGHVIHDC